MVRFLGRCLAFGVAVVLALQAFPWAWAAMAVPAASPFVLLTGLLARRSVGQAVLLGLPGLMLAAWHRRWLCLHVCPVGLLNEQAGRPRRSRRWSYRRVPHVGRFLAIAALGAATAGYPLVLWLDPFSLFSGALGALRRPFAWSGLAAAAGLAIVLAISAGWPGLWCRRLCPLGATQEFVYAVRALPRRTRSSNVAPGAAEPRIRASRRVILAAGTGAVAAWILPLPLRANPARRLRPPGALTEDRFTTLCTRCGNCIRVCPHKIIAADLSPDRLLGLLAPRVEFIDDFCHVDCHRCTTVCPSGAIANLALADKQYHPIGLAAVNRDECLLAQGLECGYCAGACPCEAIAFSEEGGPSSPVVSAERCIGCGACQVVCPTSDPRAIRVVPIERA